MWEGYLYSNKANIIGYAQHSLSTSLFVHFFSGSG